MKEPLCLLTEDDDGCEGGGSLLMQMAPNAYKQ